MQRRMALSVNADRGDVRGRAAIACVVAGCKRKPISHFRRRSATRHIDGLSPASAPDNRLGWETAGIRQQWLDNYGGNVVTLRQQLPDFLDRH